MNLRKRISNSKFKGIPLFKKSIDLVIVGLFLLSLGLRWLIPAQIVPNSPNDDYLGVMLAHNLLHGHWLGPWSPDILSKPPAYSFFLALAHFIPVDPTVILHIAYLFVSYYFVFNLTSYLDKTSYFKVSFARLAFLFFAFNPAMFAADFSRIYRISLNTIAVFLFFALLLKLINVLREIYLDGEGQGWRVVKFRRLAWIAVLLGATYALIVLTRVEGFWVLITSIPLIFGIWGYSISRNEIHWKSRKKYVSGKILLKFTAISFVTYLIPIGFVSAINYSVYGVPEIENYFTGNYARAINLWEGVSNGKSNLAFIPVSKGQRAAVYAVSPAAFSLKPTLDGPPNTGWKSFNCSATKVCDESGSWFSWELRSAAVINQHISNEVEFQSFFGRLADQIASACKDHGLTCGNTGSAPSAKALNDIPIHELIDTTIKAFASLFNVDQAENVGHLDNGQDPAELKIWHSTVHFKYLIVQDNYSNWKGMAQSISFLRNLYRSIIPILFIVAIFSLSLKRSTLLRILKWYALAIFGAMLIFSAGLAVLESSFGFGAPFSFYALPMQPLLLIFITVGIFVSTNSKTISKSE